jgi:hypothetical protein
VAFSNTTFGTLMATLGRLDRHYPMPAIFRGDLGFDRGTFSAGLAAGQGGLQVAKFPAGFGQGLLEAA